MCSIPLAHSLIRAQQERRTWMDYRKSSNERGGLSRRQFMAAATAAAGTAVLPRAAHASSDVIVGTWGGDYQQLLRDHVEPVLQKAGINVVYDVGDSDTRMAKVASQRMLPRGTTDVQCFDSIKAYSLRLVGALEKLDPAQMSNWKNLVKVTQDDYLLPQIISPQVILYDPDRTSNPATDLDDLTKPEYKGKFGFIASNYLYLVVGGSIVKTGTPSDFEAGKAFCQELNANGMKLYPQVDMMAQAFQSGEIEQGIIWQARGNMWQDAGVKLKSVIPAKGTVLYTSGMVMPKNAPNKEAGFKYLDAVISDVAQRGFAINMGYAPAIKDAGMTPEEAARYAIPSDGPKMFQPDLEKMSPIISELFDWWKKSIERA
jgi:putative spermidine/putrescine transport system substrate-binding protein